MDTCQLNNIDDLEIQSVLEEIEQSFHIRFDRLDFAKAATFGQMFDVINRRIPGVDAGGCTSQQAFYKLREALAAVQPDVEIRPHSLLSAFFPQRNREELVELVEGRLGFSLDVPGLPGLTHGHGCVLGLMGLVSVLGFQFGATPGLLGLGVTALAWLVARHDLWPGDSLEGVTVADCVQAMTRKHYLACRRDPATVNRSELFTHLQNVFMARLDLERAVLHRDATFN